MTKTKKPPPNTPNVGDDVKLRGRVSFGCLTELNERNLWARVDWDPTVAANCPKLCHLYELERCGARGATLTSTE